MSLYMRWKNASELNGLSHALKSSDAEDKSDNDTKKRAVHTSENDTAASDQLTLDDFGGRSDALGG